MFLAKYGDNAVAAMGVAMKANMLVVMFQIGVGQGIQPLVGYCFGAKRYERMKKVIRFSMMCNIIIGAAVTLFYIVSGDRLSEYLSRTSRLSNTA